jgi:hypothetical protein
MSAADAERGRDNEETSRVAAKNTQSLAMAVEQLLILLEMAS